MSHFICGFSRSYFAAGKQNFLSLSSRWLVVKLGVKHLIQMPSRLESYTESHVSSHVPNRRHRTSATVCTFLVIPWSSV